MRVFRPPDVPAWLSVEDYLRLCLTARIVDARPGGLIVGRRHRDGHVWMYAPVGDDGGRVVGFEVRGAAEGGEYLLNHAAYFSNREHVDALNREGQDVPVEARDYPALAVSPATRVINTHRAGQDRFLLLDERGQFLVNRAATVRHLGELERMNDRDRDC